MTEAVSENAKTKLAVYQALGEVGFAGILTTNTSSLARETLLADSVYDREKFALLTSSIRSSIHKWSRS